MTLLFTFSGGDIIAHDGERVDLASAVIAAKRATARAAKFWATGEIEASLFNLRVAEEMTNAAEEVVRWGRAAR